MIKSEPIEIDQKENLQRIRPELDPISLMEHLRMVNQQLNDENQRLKNEIIVLNNKYHKTLTELDDAREYLMKILSQLD